MFMAVFTPSDDIFVGGDVLIAPFFPGDLVRADEDIGPYAQTLTR